jgi:hypothetical protein
LPSFQSYNDLVALTMSDSIHILGDFDKEVSQRLISRLPDQLQLKIMFWLLRFLEWKEAGFLTQNGYRLLLCISLDILSDNVWSADYPRLEHYCDRVWRNIASLPYFFEFVNELPVIQWHTRPLRREVFSDLMIRSLDC